MPRLAREEFPERVRRESVVELVVGRPLGGGGYDCFGCSVSSAGD